MDYSKFIKLLFCIIICELAGLVGSYYTIPKINSWYKGLNKPFFNPPSWIFGPVWTVLFVLMGISLYIVWQNKWEPKNKINFKNNKKPNALSQKFLSGSWKKLNIVLIFVIQLGLNILWSAIFFGKQAPGAAFFELLMLWFAIIFMIVNFYRVSKMAAWLLIPYILWVSFAGFLNFLIWILN